MEREHKASTIANRIRKKADEHKTYHVCQYKPVQSHGRYAYAAPPRQSQRHLSTRPLRKPSPRLWQNAHSTIVSSDRHEKMRVTKAILPAGCCIIQTNPEETQRIRKRETKHPKAEHATPTTTFTLMCVRSASKTISTPPFATTNSQTFASQTITPRAPHMSCELGRANNSKYKLDRIRRSMAALTNLIYQGQCMRNGRCLHSLSVSAAPEE